MKTIVAAAITVTAIASCERAQDDTTTNFLMPSTPTVLAHRRVTRRWSASPTRPAGRCGRVRTATTWPTRLGLRPGWTKSTLPGSCSSQPITSALSKTIEASNENHRCGGC